MTDAREVIRCLGCNLVQFMTRSGLCRRCSDDIRPVKPYELPKEALIPEPDEERPRFLENAVMMFGKRLCELRNERGWSQSKLCSLTGVSRGFMSRLETGRMCPSLNTVERLAKGLNVNCDAFFREAKLFEDDFIREVAPLLRGLSGEQHRQLLAVVIAAAARS